MTTRARIRRDRMRYNALRRLVHSRWVRPLPRYEQLTATDVHVLAWRAWTTCSCGRRRQNVRFC